jgi:hypothetical protein
LVWFGINCLVISLVWFGGLVSTLKPSCDEIFSNHENCDHRGLRFLTFKNIDNASYISPIVYLGS